MTLPSTPASDQDAAPVIPPIPPRETETGWRGWLDNDFVTYPITFVVMVTCCLLIPKLLNNMIFVFIMLSLGLWLVPDFLKKHLGRREP